MAHDYTTDEQKVSYGVGRQMGEQLASGGFEGVDASAVAAGVIDALGAKPSAVPEAELEAAFKVIAERMEAKQQEAAKALAADGEAFLASNAERLEVTVTDSGLQYEVLEQGLGERPEASSTVQVHYRGTLIDGTVFDSSYDRGQPAEFPVGGVIAGWTEALQLMNVGSKYRVYIPQELGYGPRGAGQAIPPYAALVFDVELLAVVG
jgi:FKBP-type peptidyl-prolyl cis-trans isomerase FklB